MKKFLLSSFLLLLTLLISALFSNAASAVKVGAEVLHERSYSGLLGKRIGLVTNQTAVVGEKTLVDLMVASGKVNLVAIFAPEHGFRVQKEDGVKIGESRDELTNIKVYSLYGSVMKPTLDMMRGVDVFVFDVQDIGARFYTYISTMGLAMQAAAEMHIPFVVLDRPNPLGGNYVGGSILEKQFASFTGKYPIPIAHGMTVGELALMIKGEKMLSGLEGLDLRIVKMSGWQRDMLWPETGLKWIRTSPNIPDFDSALLYAGICLFEGTSASVGRGTMEPFKIVGYPEINATELANSLNNRKLPGVNFAPTTFTPRSIPGMSSNPEYKDKEITGIRISITERHTYLSVETAVHMVSALYKILAKKDQEQFFSRTGFDHLAGTSSIRLAVERGISPDEIISGWKGGLDQFLEKRAKYLLY